MDLCKHVVVVSLAAAWMAVFEMGCARPPKATDSNNTAAARSKAGLPAVAVQRQVTALQRHGDMLFAATHVNHKSVGLFLVDTGSTLDVIGQGIAGRLKLPEAGQSTAMGIGGPESFVFRRADHLRIGAIERHNPILASLYLNRFQRPFGVSINGIIGFGSLRKQPFTIDYQSPSLTLHTGATFAPPRDAWLGQLHLVHGLPAVRARLAGVVDVVLVLDTGADNHVTLPRRLLAESPGIVAVPQTGIGRSMGIGGVTDDIKTWLRTLAVFGLTLHDVPVSFTAAPLGRPLKGPPVGRIGSALLRSFRLTFDARQQSLWVLFRPHDTPIPGSAADPPVKPRSFPPKH